MSANIHCHSICSKCLIFCVCNAGRNDVVIYWPSPILLLLALWLSFTVIFSRLMCCPFHLLTFHCVLVFSRNLSIISWGTWAVVTGVVKLGCVKQELSNFVEILDLICYNLHIYLNIIVLETSAEQMMLGSVPPAEHQMAQ